MHYKGFSSVSISSLVYTHSFGLKCISFFVVIPDVNASMRKAVFLDYEAPCLSQIHSVTSCISSILSKQVIPLCITIMSPFYLLSSKAGKLYFFHSSLRHPVSSLPLSLLLLSEFFCYCFYFICIKTRLCIFQSLN